MQEDSLSGSGLGSTARLQGAELQRASCPSAIRHLESWIVGSLKIDLSRDRFGRRTDLDVRGGAGRWSLFRLDLLQVIQTCESLGSTVEFHMNVVLESVDATRDRFRFYVLTIEPDLFSEWALVVTWGRIGRPGRTRIAASGDFATVQLASAQLQGVRLRHGYKVIWGGQRERSSSSEVVV